MSAPPNRIRWDRVIDNNLKFMKYSNDATTMSKFMGFTGGSGKRTRKDSGVTQTPVKKVKTLPSKKTMPKSSATNKLVNQSSMKMVGKRKLKKVKRVKVGKRLTQSIKQVIQGEQAKGSYTRVYTGFVGQVMNVNSTGSPRFAGTTNTFAAVQAACLGPNYQEPAGQRTLWGTLSQAVPIATSFVNGNLSTGSEFNYFTIRKFLDAASLCFNRKTLGINSAESTVDNFDLIFDPVTGATYGGTPTPLKLNITNSWVQFTLRNLSQRVVHLDIWECTPTLKFQNTTALQSLITSLNSAGQQVMDSVGTVDAVVRYFNRLSGSGQSSTQDGLINEGTIDAVDIAKQFGFNFKVVKRQMVLQPSETCIHSIKGPTGMLDFSKMTVDNVQQLNLLKGMSVSCIFAVRGDQLLPGTTNAISRFTKIGAAPSAGGANYFSTPVAVEVKESITVAVPEVAGFITKAGGAGQRQTLNLRKKRIVYANFIDANGDTAAAGSFSGNNENNPAANISTF